MTSIIDPNGTDSNTGFTVVGAGTAHEAIDDGVRSPTTPSGDEKITVGPGTVVSGICEIDLGSLEVGEVTRVDVFVYAVLQGNTSLGGGVTLAADLRWDGELQAGGAGTTLASESAGDEVAGWYTTGFDVAGGQAELDAARLKLVIGGDVVTGEVWAAYVQVTYSPAEAEPEPEPEPTPSGHTINVSEIQTFTNAQLATIYRSCAVNAALAQNYSIGGKSLSRFSPRELNAMADAHEAAAARETRGAFSLASFRPME